MPFAFPQSGTLFTLEGRRWVNRTLLQKIEGACMLAGQPRINIHTLRHAHCTFELASSYEQTNIQGLMVRCGWRTLSMVSRYMEKARTFEIKGSYLPPWPSEDKKDQSK